MVLTTHQATTQAQGQCAGLAKRQSSSSMQPNKYKSLARIGSVHRPSHCSLTTKCFEGEGRRDREAALAPRKGARRMKDANKSRNKALLNCLFDETKTFDVFCLFSFIFAQAVYVKYENNSLQMVAILGLTKQIKKLKMYNTLCYFYNALV